MRIPLITVSIAVAALVAGCSKSQEQAAPANTTAAAGPAPGQATQGPGEGGPGGFAESQTLDQMLERSMNRFARLDLNGDGKVTQDELEQGRQGGPGGGDNAQGQRGGGRRGMARADANGDGVITKDEFQAQTRERFKRLDANGDGTVTRDEMAAQRANRRGQGGGDGAGGAPAQ